MPVAEIRLPSVDEYLTDGSRLLLVVGIAEQGMYELADAGSDVLGATFALTPAVLRLHIEKDGWKSLKLDRAHA